MSDLMHFGVRGMKWGVRRYQNYDGTLTTAGRRRIKETDSRRSSRVHEEVSKDYLNIKNISEAGSKASFSGKNIAGRIGQRKREKVQSKMDLSKMSDQELQKAINRLNLERNYKNLMTSEISTGSKYVEDIMSTAGDILAIGASAASIMVAIHQLKK